MIYPYRPNWRFLVKASNGVAHYCTSSMEAIACARILFDKHGLQSTTYRRRDIETKKN